MTRSSNETQPPAAKPPEPSYDTERRLPVHAEVAPIEDEDTEPPHERTHPIARADLADALMTAPPPAPPPPPARAPSSSARMAVAGPRTSIDGLRGETLPPVVSSYGIEDVREHFARGDFDGALAVAEALLVYDPSNQEAKSYAASCELRLRRSYAARIGAMRRVPRSCGDDEPVDERQRRMLAAIDGVRSAEEALRASGLVELDALRAFVALLDRGVVAFE